LATFGEEMRGCHRYSSFIHGRQVLRSSESPSTPPTYLPASTARTTPSYSKS
jgi:hypothetical protein